MIQDTDEQVEQDIIDNLPITNESLFSHGFEYEMTESGNRWIFKDKAGYDCVVFETFSSIKEYPRMFGGHIYYPKYVTTKYGDSYIDSGSLSETVSMYNQGQLEYFVKAANLAAEIRSNEFTLLSINRDAMDKSAAITNIIEKHLRNHDPRRR